MEAPIPERVVELLGHAAKLAAKSGLILSIENDGGCWGATTGIMAELLRLIAQPNVGITWDPANAFRAGEERVFPDDYKRFGAAFVMSISRTLLLTPSQAGVSSTSMV